MKAETLRLTWMKSTILVLSVIMLSLLGMSNLASAQEVTATINGTVTDPAGAIISNADVVAKDLDRGTTWATKTNAQGFYHLARLPVGRYEVRVTASGFRSAVQSPIPLQLNQVAAVNIQMVVGQTSETVSVTGEAPLLQTETTQVGTVIDQRTNVDLPLASRNYLQLTLVTPGAVTPQPAGFNSGKNSGEVARPEINGNRFTANNYVLDGMDNNQMSDNFVGFAPQPDAIQEFNLITQNAPADFGNYMGGIISASIRSGTNKFHGSVFEFFRNDVLNANEWQNKLQTPYTPRPKLRWNQFGAAVGGPIIKNKLFFFTDYQGERFNIPASGSNFSVLTTLERQGNVSELVAAGLTIKDPLTGNPFPGNVIPANRLSPAAMAIINSSNYPKPINSNLTSNALNVRGTQTNNDQGDVKIDWEANERNHFMGRFSDTNLRNPTINSYDLRYNPLNLTEAWNFVLDYTRTINPHMINDARFGVNYVKIGQNHVSANFSGDASSLFKIPGLPTEFLPAMQFQGTTATGGNSTMFGTKASINDYADTVIQYQDVFSFTHGKHNTRVGFQGWRLRMNGIFPGNSGDAGTFTFNGQYSGSAETDFLLGLPAQLGVGLPGPNWGHRGNIFGAFIQDDWKVTSKLTANLGLRWETHTRTLLRRKAFSAALLKPLLLLGTSIVQAQKQITIQANAKGTGTQMGRMIAVKIIINSFSTDDDRRSLIEGFNKDRTEGMRSALEKMKPKGRISPERSVGNDVKYIRELPAENGQRRFRLVTDRNVAFAELYAGTRSRDYSVGALELTINADGKSGTGTVLPACSLKLNKKTNEVEIETYQNPWKLENFIVHFED